MSDTVSGYGEWVAHHPAFKQKTHPYEPSEFCDGTCHPQGVNNGPHCANCGQPESATSHYQPRSIK